MRLLLLLVGVLGAFGLVYFATARGYLSDSMAAWAQAILSAGAIFAAALLQDRDRLKRNQEDRRRQIHALHAIAERCVYILAQLNERAQHGRLQKGDFIWLSEEVEANEATVARIDLMQIANPKLIRDVSTLSRAMRRAKRRLGYARDRAERGELPERDWFKTAYDDVVAVVAELEQIKATKLWR